MRLGSLGGTTLQTLKLAAIPSPSSFLYRNSHRQRPQFPLSPLEVSQPRPHKPLSPQHIKTTSPDEKGVKPQWKAAIDFKWIRDNNEAVAANIKKRNSNANLELVLELCNKMLNLQKSMVTHRKQEVERLRGERNAVANKMKGKLESAERQKLIEEGIIG